MCIITWGVCKLGTSCIVKPKYEHNTPSNTHNNSEIVSRYIHHPGMASVQAVIEVVLDNNKKLEYTPTYEHYPYHYGAVLNL